MTPIPPPLTNAQFGPPPDMAESQVHTIPAHLCIAQGGSVDGSHICVVAWQPSDEELKILNQTKVIYISMLGGLAPHFLTVDFDMARKPA